MSSRQENTNLDYIMGVGDPSDGVRRPELPNRKLEVRIQLTKILEASAKKSLESDLRNDEMEVHKDDNLKNVIVVSGILPEGGYEKKNVLNKVKAHDDGAYIL